MKHLLILIVAIAIYLHFYPNEQASNFYNKQKDFLLDQFSQMSDTKVRLKAEKVYTDLKPKLGSFSVEEVAHLKSITASRRQVEDFYNDVCQTDKRDVVFHLHNQLKVCETISHYKHMF